MQCPACDRQLDEKTVDGVLVDVCDGGCGGIWFDNYEVKKFDEPHEPAQALIEVKRNPGIQIDYTQRRKCPKCDDQVMMRHFSSVKHEVEVDECPGCGGIWLDDGELSHIRGLYDSEEQQKEATKKHFQEVFGSKLAQMRSESQAELAKARRFANLFRFICPSHYVPGDQEWGAF